MANKINEKKKGGIEREPQIKGKKQEEEKRNEMKEGSETNGEKYIATAIKITINHQSIIHKSTNPHLSCPKINNKQASVEPSKQGWRAVQRVLQHLQHCLS